MDFSVLRRVIPAIALSCSFSASAAVVSYTDLSTWQGASGSTTIENFDGSTVGTFGGDPYSATGFNGFSLSGDRNGDFVGIGGGSGFANINGTNFLCIGQREDNANFGGGDGCNLGGTGNGNGGVGPSLTFTFVSAITAFGFDWKDSDFSDLYEISVDGSVFSNPPFSTGTGSGFFGVVSDIAFSSVTFTQTAAGGFIGAMSIDDVRTSSVSEPGTLVLMGLGLIGLGIRRIKNRIRA